MIEEGITKYDNTRTKQIGIYYPSEIYECRRKLWYSYHYPTSLDFETRKNFAVGIALHELVQSSLVLYLKNSQTKVYNELEKMVYKGDGYELHGRLDTIIFEEDGKTHVVEFKTTNSLNKIKQLMPHHFEQINYYLHFYPEAEGHLIYINKKAKAKLKTWEAFKEFNGIQYSDPAFKQSLERTKMADDHLKNNTLPVAEAKQDEKTKWQCWYCPFKAKCDKNEN